MSDPKPLLVLWSKAAACAAGRDISTLQDKLTAEAIDIVPQAEDWFLHTIPGASERECFVCTGHELPDTWKVFVRKGFYTPMPPIRDDHPDPAQRGKVLHFPQAINDPDNGLFASYQDISGH